MGLRHRVVGGLRLEVVVRLAELEVGLLADVRRGLRGELGVRVESRADRGAAEREFAEVLAHVLDAADALFDLRAVAAELLSEADGRGVLQVGSAGLDDAVELGFLVAERRGERLQRGKQVLLDGFEGGDVHGRRNHVVGRLAEVDVVVRVDDAVTDALAHNLRGAVGDDLVGVHVRRRARPGLEHVDGELVVELAGDDFVGGLDDAVRLVVGIVSRSRFACAAAFFTTPSARTNRRPKVMPEMGKFSTARWVCAPQ